MFSCDGWVEGFHLVRSSTLSDQSCTLHSRPLDEYWYLHVRWGNALFHVRCHVDSPGLFSIEVLGQTRLKSFLFKGRTKHRKKSNDETLTISMPNWVFGLFKWIELRHQQPKETQLVHYPLTWKQITVVFGSATEGYAACVSINKRAFHVNLLTERWRLWCFDTGENRWITQWSTIKGRLLSLNYR